MCKQSTVTGDIDSKNNKGINNTGNNSKIINIKIGLFNIFFNFKGNIKNKELEKYNNEALKLLENNKNDDAISKFTEAIEKHPKSDEILDIYYNRSSVYFMSSKSIDDKKLLKAIDDCSVIINLNKQYVYEALYNRGTIYAIQGKDNLAIDDLKKCIEIRREYCEPYNNLGLIYSKNHDLEEALTYFEKAEEAQLYKPEYLTEEQSKHYKSTILINIGILFLQKEDIAIAIKYLEKALDTYDSHIVHINLGVTYMQKYKSSEKNIDFKKAEDEFQKSIKKDKDFSGNYNSLGDLYNTKGNIELQNDEKESKLSYSEALKYYEQAIQVCKEKEEDNSITKSLYLCKIASIQIKLGKWLDAVKSYEESISINMENALAYYNLANIYYDKTDYDNAIRYYEQATYYNKNYDETYNNLGLCYFQKYMLDKLNDNFENAEYFYKKTININPKHLGGYYNLGTLYSLSNRYSEALEYLLKCEKYGLSNSMLYYNIGIAYSQIGNIDESMVYIIKAYEISNSLNENHIKNPSISFIKDQAQNGNKRAIHFLNALYIL